ncbi:ABC transporter permease [Planococcus sp. CAU13]|uniref:ABC transporter permease n=1 Tax=Planococcus sp. CAU13 TaxID=1541197 RepID=UPI00053000BB|nr:ABC transporter permease [Planococcus sp. CAU13]
MWAFLKKDILVLLRDRTELAVLLLMPFILIVILGFSLRGLMAGNTEALNMQVALVQNDDEQAGITEFTEQLETLELQEQTVAGMAAAAEQASPFRTLQMMLASPELAEMISVEEMGAAAARDALEEEEVVAILTIPENFTRLALDKMLLGTGPGTELALTIEDTTSTRADVFETLISDFARALNFETAASRVAAEEGISLEGQGAMELGGLETTSSGEPVDSFQYYTLGIAVMFVLFVSANVAGNTNVERNRHVFDRIMLSNRHPFMYLGGKAISAAMIAFTQLFILFFLSTLVLQAFEWDSLNFWLGMALVSAMLSLCAGALAAFLTTLTVRLNSDAITTVFSGGIVTIFAFLGGSFIPLTGMPDIIQELGNWTPNGASLTAFLQWVQQRDLAAVTDPLVRIGGTAAVLFALSLALFPVKGAN